MPVGKENEKRKKKKKNEKRKTKNKKLSTVFGLYSLFLYSNLFSGSALAMPMLFFSLWLVYLGIHFFFLAMYGLVLAHNNQIKNKYQIILAESSTINRQPITETKNQKIVIKNF